VRLQGTPPSPTARIKGCVFASRCPRKVGAICETTPPPVQNLADGRKLACHIPVDELARLQGAVPAVPAL
jgi:peptide/nickel transport system ATP-binding protein